jgi:hypothetical protein
MTGVDATRILQRKNYNRTTNSTDFKSLSWTAKYRVPKRRTISGFLPRTIYCVVSPVRAGSGRCSLGLGRPHNNVRGAERHVPHYAKRVF